MALTPEQREQRQRTNSRIFTMLSIVYVPTGIFLLVLDPGVLWWLALMMLAVWGTSARCG